MAFVHWLVVVSVGFSVAGSFAYIRGTLRGTTKPNRISWLMWAAAPLIGTGAALSAHADVWVTARIFLAGFIPLTVLVASFINKQSYWKLDAFDIICGACSLLALIVWLGVDAPKTAILLAALGDGFASLPTIRKSWQHPETETGLTYIFGLIATLLVLPSIPSWNIQNSAFQIYLLLANTCLIFAVYRKRLLFSQP